MQAAAAAAVAGDEPLVLVVGPAGAGKTRTLERAVDDLRRQGRVVFGVAPTAKAARTLQRDAGVEADTVAKLLHEWSRPDRPPTDRYRLPAGSTVLVDEAGMIGTGSLHRLVTLAEHHQWRLVLVGDPRQLQAVGRGGMFHQLCRTGPVHELQRIHRFTAPWEAAASLQPACRRPGRPRRLPRTRPHRCWQLRTARRHHRRPMDRSQPPWRDGGDHRRHQRPRRRTEPQDPARPCQARRDRPVRARQDRRAATSHVSVT
ncbi:MAG: AAA family ATPase [Ilumatobacteraceae bacterium]